MSAEDLGAYEGYVRKLEAEHAEMAALLARVAGRIIPEGHRVPGHACTHCEAQRLLARIQGEAG